MSQDRRGWCRSPCTRVWVHLGASGVLQPLSEEFLYRSPGARLCLTCRRPSDRPRGKDHAEF